MDGPDLSFPNRIFLVQAMMWAVLQRIDEGGASQDKAEAMFRETMKIAQKALAINH